MILLQSSALSHNYLIVAAATEDRPLIGSSQADSRVIIMGTHLDMRHLTCCHQSDRTRVNVMGDCGEHSLKSIFSDPVHTGHDTPCW